MDVDPIPLSRDAARGIFVLPKPEVIRPLDQIGPVIYHGPSQIDEHRFNGWNEFPGAAIEYLSPAIAERLCTLWAEPADWVRMRYWIEGVQLSVAHFAGYDGSRWTGDSIEELAFLKLITAARAASP